MAEQDWRENTTVFKEQIKSNTGKNEQSRSDAEEKVRVWPDTGKNDQNKLNAGEQGLRGRNLTWYLEVIEGPDSGKVIALQSEEIVVGRHGRCELILSDPEVSRRHMKFTPGSNGWRLEDLRSTNGTYINGWLISRQTVKPGDIIQIGQSAMVIHGGPSSG